MGVLLLFYILPIPTLVLFTLVSCIDKIDKLYFKCEIGIKPNIGEVV
jgi:hypothetical protein